MEFSVRQAKNDDGPTIGEIATRQGFGFDNWDFDWSDIEPYWVVVENNKKIVGAIQFSPGKPLAWMEFMVLEPEVPTKQRVEIANRLVGACIHLAMIQGAQGLSTTLSLSSFKQHMERQGWTESSNGTLYIRKV